jgi:hypothetical protein
MMPKPGSPLDKAALFISNLCDTCLLFPIRMVLDKTIWDPKVRPLVMDARLQDELIKHLGGSTMSITFAKNALRKGGNPNVESGRLLDEPLIVAATRYRCPQYVQVLAEAGADTTAARKMAEERGFGEITAALNAAKPAKGIQP